MSSITAVGESASDPDSTPCVTPGSPAGGEPTTSSRAFWPPLDYVKARGLEVDELIAATGYSEHELREPDRRIPRQAVISLMRALRAASDEPALGFAFAAFVKSETFDLLEYMARASATMRDAMLVAGRYSRIVDGSYRSSIQSIDGRVMWRIDSDWPADVEPTLVEYLLAVLGVVGRRLFGNDIPIQEIWVRWPEPEQKQRYVRAFGFPVRFDAPFNAIVYPAGAIDVPLRHADPTLAKLLERQAEGMLASLVSVDRLSDQVKNLLTEELRGQEPSMQSIARRLGTTSSTLRRRLSAEGTTFKQLLEVTRLELARACLADPRLSINETAFLLGYSDVSTFFKFFRRSTGRTPAQYRKEARAALAS